MLVPHNLLEAPPQQRNEAHGHVALLQSNMLRR
jgi:hypothetical protein